MSERYDAAVIGCGITGLATAADLALRGLRTVALEANTLGGLVVGVNELEPNPSSAHRSGAEFASALAEIGSERGVEYRFQAVESLDSCDAGFVVDLDGERLVAHTVVVASGARLKLLDVPGEAENEGRGVGHCADCDGPIYAGQDVVVVGGGDSAFQEALVLATFCRRVTIVHRGAEPHASARLIAEAAGLANVERLGGTTVSRILGSDGVSGVELQDLRTGAQRSLDCAGVFPFVGLNPNVEFLRLMVTRDAAGFIVADSSCATSVPRLYAAGIVRAGCGGLLQDALADAASAAAAIGAKHRPIAV